MFFTADQSLFLAINRLPHSFIADNIALLLSGVGQWGAIWFVIAFFLFLREEKRDHWFFVPLIVSSLTGWLLSDWLIKFLVARTRPTAELGAIIVRETGNYSFPSTHATLAFALAFVLSQEEPKLKMWFYLLAILISLSRIYLGVHYPVDIAAGAVLGSLIGYASLVVTRRIRKLLV